MATRGPLLIDEQPDDAKILRRTRLRLMAVSGFVTLIILIVLGLAVYTMVSSVFASDSQNKLKGFADQITSVATRTQPANPGEVEPEFGGEYSGLMAWIGDRSGVPIAASRFLPSSLPVQSSVSAALSGRTDVREATIQGRSFTGAPGRALSVRVYSAPIRSSSGSIVGVVQTIADRTQEVALLDLLRGVLLVGGLAALLASLLAGYLYAGRALVPIRESLERRRLALQRQREFTANASHELRTPLTVIRTSVEDLRRNRRARVEDVGDALEDIDAEVNHLTALVEDLLLLARTDSGVVQIERQPVDLADSAAEAVSLLAPLAQRQGVAVVLDPLPAPLAGDPLRLRQLVTILVDNAIRHSPRESQVTVVVRGESREATVQVEDQGPGIRPEDLPRIFERFWRADNAPAGGTGLGLAIARWIVDQHGGTITAANRDGGGARFVVRLPVIASAGEAEPAEPEAHAVGAWIDDLADEPSEPDTAETAPDERIASR